MQFSFFCYVVFFQKKIVKIGIILHRGSVGCVELMQIHGFAELYTIAKPFFLAQHQQQKLRFAVVPFDIFVA